MTRKLLEFAIARVDDKIANHSIWNRFSHSWQQSLFMDLCKQAYALLPDGETSAGHQKFRHSTPEEAVAEAAAMVELILAESERRGFLIEQPPFDELREASMERPGFVNGADALHGKS